MQAQTASFSAFSGLSATLNVEGIISQIVVKASSSLGNITIVDRAGADMLAANGGPIDGASDSQISGTTLQWPHASGYVTVTRGNAVGIGTVTIYTI